MKQPNKTGRRRVAGRGERSEYAPGQRRVGGRGPMKEESTGPGGSEARGSESSDLDAVANRLRDIQRGKSARIRWGMSRHTAERALEAIRLEEKLPYRRSAKTRRRKRNKRLL